MDLPSDDGFVVRFEPVSAATSFSRVAVVFSLSFFSFKKESGVCTDGKVVVYHAPMQGRGVPTEYCNLRSVASLNGVNRVMIIMFPLK